MFTVSLGGAGTFRRLGLKISTMMSPKIIKSSRKMHFRLPVFFWYLEAHSGECHRNRRNRVQEKRTA